MVGWSISFKVTRRESSELIELVGCDAELIEESIKERRADFAAAVNGNGDGASILAIPSLVTPGLSPTFEP
jgi:hypothetical protein